ncbi:MAG: (Fe-S)-binding protein [Thermoplasmata archaeon]|nr:(Fe-S)-binding protein [Thermoplasmata archaeon]
MSEGKKIKGDRLKEFYDQTLLCTSCGYCKSVCPAFKGTLWDHNTARSKMVLAYGLLEGDIEVDDSVVNSIFECTTCGDCARRCPSNVKTYEVLMAARQELAEIHCIPENLGLALKNVDSHGNPQGEVASAREEFLSDEAKAKVGGGGDVLVYLGCVTSITDMKLASAIFKILEKANVSYTTLGEKEPCCGFLNHLAGQSSERFGQSLLDAINTLSPRPKLIVTPCPGCYRSLHTHYPEEGVDLNIEVKHILEFLETLIEKGDLVVTKQLEGNVLYHDPCDLGRHADIYEPPRKLLGHFTDVKEFEFNRDKSHCCGGGGGLQSTNYDISSTMSMTRMGEAKELEADYVVSACPACKSMLSTAAVDLKKETGKKIRVQDLVEIVAKHTKGRE